MLSELVSEVGLIVRITSSIGSAPNITTGQHLGGVRCFWWDSQSIKTGSKYIYIYIYIYNINIYIYTHMVL